MSGHSKWANIKRRKGAADAQRGAVFTKLIREITVAARIGGGDTNSNARLRTAVDKARSASMPRDNIERAIAKGSGEIDMAAYEEVQFEGYGNGGIAVMVQTLTDNRNRTTADIRHAFTKCGGTLGITGCVSRLFNRCGVINIEAEGVDEDELMMTALEAGADDVSREGEQFEVVCEPLAFEALRAALEKSGYTVASAEVTYLPATYTSVEGKQAEQITRFVEIMDDNDDVQNVYTNADISDEEMNRISG